MKYSNLRFACSELAGKYLYNCTNFKIIKNAINIDNYKFNINIRKKLRNEFHFSDNEIIIGQIGHIDKNKNQMFSLHILKQLPRNYKLVIVGVGDCKELNEYIEKNNLSTRVLFLGERNDAYKLYNIFDLVYIPSLHEGLSLVCIEAQANGLPVICSSFIPKEASISDLVSFVDLKDEQLWVDKTTSLKFNDRNIYSSLIIDNGYDIKKAAINLENIYLNLEKL